MEEPHLIPLTSFLAGLSRILAIREKPPGGSDINSLYVCLCHLILAFSRYGSKSCAFHGLKDDCVVAEIKDCAWIIFVPVLDAFCLIRFTASVQGSGQMAPNAGLEPATPGLRVPMLY